MPPRQRKDGDQPDFITNRDVADIVSSFLNDQAVAFEKMANENGMASLAGANLRTVRRAAHQLRALLALDKPETEDVEQTTTDEHGGYG